MASLSEEILSGMTLDEKIGQLFMIPACPKRDENHLKDLKKLLDVYHIGSVIIKQSDPIIQISFLNYLQSISKYPLLVSADAEWGLAMRMENTIAFPKNMTLGAVSEDSLIYEMGKEIGRMLRSVGVHINLAPVVDINNNPLNPIIKIRAFSDDKYKVAKKALQLVNGMKDENVIACIKHFPGYGDIVTDPHLGLPVAYHDYKRLQDIEFYPYDFLIDQGVEAIMTAHIMLPNLSDKPATMSKKIIDILIKDKNYKNLIITDALNMKALTDHYSIEEIALESHMSGNDILLYGDHIGPNVDDILNNQIPRAFNAIKQAYLDNKLNEKYLDKCVLKILKAKESLKLFENRSVPDYDPKIILNPNALFLKKRLFDQALTIVKNNNSIFPIDLNKKIAYISSKKDLADDLIAQDFLSDFKSYTIDSVNFNFPSYDYVIIGIYESDLSEDLINRINKLKAKNISIFFFGSVYKMIQFLNFENIILAYEEDDYAIESAIDFIRNRIKANGILPIHICD
jgi:beta-glucosidase-like glycosyl hydrolase